MAAFAILILSVVQKMRFLDSMDDHRKLTSLGKSHIALDFSPEWRRFLCKAAEYGALEKAVKIAAVLSMGCFVVARYDAYAADVQSY